MITTIKPIYIAAAVLALLYWRNHQGAHVNGITRTQEANEANETGSDFLPDIWGMLNGHGTQSANFPNALAGSSNADPGGHAAANLGLNPSWDGGM